MRASRSVHSLSLWKALCVLGVGIVIFVVALLVYVFRFHRFSSLAEVGVALGASLFSQQHGGHRCKGVNNSHFQCLPNVFFIGASKCGTTSLSRMLLRHTNVSFIRRHILSQEESSDNYLEIHRFDRNTYAYASTWLEIADELSSSPLITRDFITTGKPLIHYTPQYLFAPTVPFELREFYEYYDRVRATSNSVGNLKFVVSLRDPIKRALSSYWFKNSRISHGINNSKSNKIDSGEY
jgi:hypothetical protein